VALAHRVVDRLLDKAGGVEQLAATLGEPFVFTDHSGGILIRAGSVLKSAIETGRSTRQTTRGWPER
jgi:hypothetical protein